jgi:hypothetical protein
MTLVKASPRHECDHGLARGPSWPGEPFNKRFAEKVHPHDIACA